MIGAVEEFLAFGLSCSQSGRVVGTPFEVATVFAFGSAFCTRFGEFSGMCEAFLTCGDFFIGFRFTGFFTIYSVLAAWQQLF